MCAPEFPNGRRSVYAITKGGGTASWLAASRAPSSHAVSLSQNLGLGKPRRPEPKTVASFLFFSTPPSRVSEEWGHTHHYCTMGG